MSVRIYALLTLFIATTCIAEDAISPTLAWKIEKISPHDSTHYTQGLELVGDRFFESAGRYGISSVFEKSRADGRVLRKHALDSRWFGEGLTVWKQQLIVLTWRERVAQVFDLQLQPQRRIRYRGEGWGLTHDEHRLIMSDGSSSLQFRDPDSFEVVDTIRVHDGARAITRLNELEFIRGWVFANVWQTDRIAIIDPSTGQVHAWLDLSALKSHLQTTADWDSREYVLNGIAYDEKLQRVYVTGKCWPLMFELSIEGLRTR